jgi:hypothetical protein
MLTNFNSFFSSSPTTSSSLHLCRYLCQHEIAQAQAMYDTCCRISHIKDKDYFNAHSFHQNTFQQEKNINVYQQQQHYSISSYTTRRTRLSHIRQTRSIINSSVGSKCLRSTQYHRQHLPSLSGEFQFYFHVRYSSRSSKHCLFRQ